MTASRTTTNFVDDFGMRLPDGYTCGECKFFGYCKKLFHCKKSSTVCDWAPSRFQLTTTPYVSDTTLSGKPK